jgi:hypothetical protein
MGARDSASDRAARAGAHFSVRVGPPRQVVFTSGVGPLLFGDEQRREQRQRCNPLLPAMPSASAQAKKHSHKTVDGLPVHSLATLLAELGNRARVICRLKAGKLEEKSNVTYHQLPEPTPIQARADELVRMFSGAGK